MVNELQLKAAIKGNLAKRMKAEEKAGAGAVTQVIRARTRGLQRNLRKQIDKAGLGKNLRNAIRKIEFPKRGNSLGAAGIVWSAASTGKRRGRQIDLLSVFEEGATIRPRQGRFLAIPAIKELRALQPSDLVEGTLFFVKVRGGSQLRFTNQPDKIAFFLVRQTRIKKRINVKAAFRKAGRNIDQAIVKNWERRFARIKS